MSSVETWYAEEQQPFTGWDLSHIETRMVQDELPWSYSTRAAELLQRARTALDLGTGGGERLLALRAHWPTRLTVTEEYPPNLTLARQRLEPLSVRVVEARLTDLTPYRLAMGSSTRSSIDTARSTRLK